MNVNRRSQEAVSPGLPRGATAADVAAPALTSPGEPGAAWTGGRPDPVPEAHRVDIRGRQGLP
jgi:hypothetical protein